MKVEEAKRVQLAYRKALALKMIAELDCNEFEKTAMRGFSVTYADITDEIFSKIWDMEEMVVLRNKYHQASSDLFDAGDDMLRLVVALLPNLGKTFKELNEEPNDVRDNVITLATCISINGIKPEILEKAVLHETKV